MDIGASNWNEADSSNTTAAPDGAPEGMSPGGLNDAIRAVMGAVKRWWGWTAPAGTAGSSTAYTLSYGVAPGALITGMSHLVEFHVANGNAPTLNVNSLGAVPLYYYSVGAWRPVPTLMWGANQMFRVAYHASSGTYRIMNRGDTTGDVIPTARSVARGGTLLCYGQAISRTDYAGLFAALGTTYGVGNGSTTFNLPDLRGMVAAGKSDMGGSDAGNLTGGGTLGAGLGAETHTHSLSVSGTVSGNTGAPNATTPADGAAPTQNVPTSAHTHSVSIAVTSTGTSGAGSNVQPTRVLNYIIGI